MKQNITKSIRIPFIGLFLLLFAIVNTSFTNNTATVNYTDSNYVYAGRWVDLIDTTNDPNFNPQFYNHDFFINFHLHYNLDNSNNSNSTIENVVQMAMDKWNNVQGSFFNLKLIANPRQTGGVNVNEGSVLDQVNVIGLDDIGYFPSNYDPLQPMNNTIAFCERKFTSTAALLCNNWWDPTLIGADIIMRKKIVDFNMVNDPGGQNTNNVVDSLYQFDAVSVIMHELGHAAGLRHPKLGNSALIDVMHTHLEPFKHRRNLSSLDEYLITRLYGGQDIGQVSSIPCNKFVVSDDDKLGGGPAIPKNCNHQSGTCNSCNKKMISSGISDKSIKESIKFYDESIDFRLRVIQELIVSEESLFTEIYEGNAPENAALKKLILEAQRELIPLYDATFRCNCHENKDLTLKGNHIELMKKIFEESLKIDIPERYKVEISLLYPYLDNCKGKNMKEAAIYLDKLGLNK